MPCMVQQEPVVLGFPGRSLRQPAPPPPLPAPLFVFLLGSYRDVRGIVPGSSEKTICIGAVQGTSPSPPSTQIVGPKGPLRAPVPK